MTKHFEQALYAGLGFGVILPVFVGIFASVTMARIAHEFVRLRSRLAMKHMTAGRR